ncbi:hypothetical protein [Bacillus sp. EB01]|uniref:hypothetical protein n=1 Tax=Bacillus sp. EB01 TaxID=1347086 RepID=UPI0005C68CD9|nr:hypothetical protein [Bacillus sp. EB01]
MGEEENTWALLVRFLAGTILTLAIVVGFYLAIEETPYNYITNTSKNFAWKKFLTYAAGGTFSFIILYAIAEMISILHDIRKKLYK